MSSTQSTRTRYLICNKGQNQDKPTPSQRTALRLQYKLHYWSNRLYTITSQKGTQVRCLQQQGQTPNLFRHDLVGWHTNLITTTERHYPPPTHPSHLSQDQIGSYHAAPRPRETHPGDSPPPTPHSHSQFYPNQVSSQLGCHHDFRITPKGHHTTSTSHPSAIISRVT